MGPGVARLRLTLLLLIATIMTFSGTASANPYSPVGYEMTAIPLALVIINYPINGCMLLFWYRRALRHRRPMHPPGEKALVVFVLAVLLFSLVGALIDTVVTWSEYDADVLPVVLPLGLVGIALSCQLISQRYLQMGSREALPGTVFVTLVNLGSWVVLDIVPPEFFIAACLPIVMGFWLAFFFYTHRTATRAMRLSAQTEPPARLDVWGRAPESTMDSIHPSSSSYEKDLKMELVGVSFILLLLVGAMGALM